MGFIILCVIYIVVCEFICSMFNVESFNKKALVYAIVGAIWTNILPHLFS